jgi:hypothetical protein
VAGVFVLREIANIPARSLRCRKNRSMDMRAPCPPSNELPDAPSHALVWPLSTPNYECSKRKSRTSVARSRHGTDPVKRARGTTRYPVLVRCLPPLWFPALPSRTVSNQVEISWIGLVPKQHSGGGKDRLGSIWVRQAGTVLDEPARLSRSFIDTNVQSLCRTSRHDILLIRRIKLVDRVESRRVIDPPYVRY